MKRIFAYGSLLLLSTALVAPGALAQSGNESASALDSGTDSTGTQAQDLQQQVEVSGPGADPEDGGEIVVVGRNIPNLIRATAEVVSILSSEDIARTGEGDIAGALQRVTGLSLVGSGLVFVRGLGDRYSLALLNGSPLPSPEPLRRVVPLDIFPTSVIASSLVQKSYSVDYPGEFGGGVINLTTISNPREPFLTVGASVGLDGETTGRLGYTYRGSRLDFLGFDDGLRDFPRGLREAVTGGTFGSTTAAQRRDFTASLRNAETTLLQRNRDIPANVSVDVSAGRTFEIGASRIGLIAAAGFGSTWRTRDALQQTSLDPQLAGIPQTSFRTVTTDNRVIANGLLGLGAEFGEHELRWTNLYIRDTLKQARLGAGFNRNVTDPDPSLPPSLIEQNSYFFERQLIDTQLVGEFKFGDLGIDVRGTYANSQRESPYERDIGYAHLGDANLATKGDGDVDDYINNLASAGQFATVAFSGLSEDVYAGALDLSYRIRSNVPITLSAGYAYTENQRTSSRYQFQYFRPEGTLPLSVAQQRPDYLLSDFNVYTYNIQLRDISGVAGAAAYQASLRIHAGYAQAEVEHPGSGLRAQLGVRYEDARQRVQPIGTSVSGTALNNAYWLPAATLTWNFAQNMQLRLHASKTIARPQFRELAPQIFQDFESDREFTGNPFLTDSKLLNAEARYEWYFARGQRFTLAGFYKKIDNPIEAAAFFAGGGQLRTGFANAPEATLYGAEIEVQAFYPLEGLASFLLSKRLLLVGNYTYSQSKLKSDNSIIISPSLQPIAANLLFQDGAALNGQSDHLANLQLGIEDEDRLSQATFLLTYASARVTNRGPIQGELRQPDIIEKPGFRLDFVAREEVALFGKTAELKLEARNLLGQDHEEYQQSDVNRIEINSYKVGRTVSLGMAVEF